MIGEQKGSRRREVRMGRKVEEEARSSKEISRGERKVRRRTGQKDVGGEGGANTDTQTNTNTQMNTINYTKTSTDLA